MYSRCSMQSIWFKRDDMEDAPDANSGGHFSTVYMRCLSSDLR